MANSAKILNLGGGGGLRRAGRGAGGAPAGLRSVWQNLQIFNRAVLGCIDTEFSD